MSERVSDVAVIGAGIMGGSAAWHLARRGYRVDLFEQYDLDHVRGSSHGASRIFRLAYDISDYTALAERALPLWREAERASGKRLLWTTGGLDLGPPEQLEPVAGTLTRAGIGFERFSGAELRSRFPAFHVPDGWEGIHQDQSGVLLADRCRATLLDLAREAGARIRAGTRVERIEPAGAEVEMQTSAGPGRAGCVVVAAAGWSNRLLEPLGLAVPLKITREHVAYFPYRGSERLIPFIWHEGTNAFQFYGLPNGELDEVKVGEHGAGPEVDPDSEGRVDQAHLESVVDFARDHLPGVHPEPRRAETCLYASTPDDDFVIEREGPIVLGFGFGGHGFKFGAVIGELLAELVEGKAIASAERFSRARFAPQPAT